MFIDPYIFQTFLISKRLIQEKDMIRISIGNQQNSDQQKSEQSRQQNNDEGYLQMEWSQDKVGPLQTERNGSTYII